MKDNFPVYGSYYKDYCSSELLAILNICDNSEFVDVLKTCKGG